MSHFPSRDWVDLAHGLGVLEQQDQMQRHLEDGCETCHKDSEFWGGIADCLSREPGLEVPEPAIRLVEAAFTSEKIPGWFALAEVPRVLFDSWMHPPAVAARAAGPRSARQVIYEAEPFVIDIRMESDPSRQHVLVTGQVLNSNSPDTGAEQVEVVLLRGEDVVARTSANAAGEFDFGCETRQELRLFINIRGQRAFGIVLPEVEGQA
ncbi:MAG TPA: hypothetical protein VLJ11_17440 [Bryobacteraceae bacterium]|nr:hypothetical protein [Bryobacteraceae bacterium]